MICPECATSFTPDRFYEVCNICGDELCRQYERIQDFDDSEMTLAVISSRCLFGMQRQTERAWVIG
jgi:hypothetical protein